jgi:hypothetical protein
MTDDGDTATQRGQLLDDLAALNDNLHQLGLHPLITNRAGQALPIENLEAAVKATADHLIDQARKLHGLI